MAERDLNFKLLATQGARGSIDADVIEGAFRISQARLTSQESLDAWVEATTIEITSLVRARLMDLIREAK